MVDDALKEFFEKLPKSTSKELNEANEFLADYTLRGGKRTRPLMTIYAAKALNPNIDMDLIVQASLPFELVQTYLLIHDDIIDRDELRRGKDTAHQHYAKKHGDAHFGTSMAINLGDLAESYTRLPLKNLAVSAETKLKLYNLIDKMLALEIQGQILDVSFEKRFPTSKEVLDMYGLKTAPYTTTFPLLFGAILGGAPQFMINEIWKNGDFLGVGFQVQDDIIGMFNGPDVTGKPMGSDILAGKPNIIISEYVRTLDIGQQNEFVNFLRSEDKKFADVESHLKNIKYSGVVDSLSKLMKHSVTTSLNEMAIFKLDNKYSDELKALTEYLIARNT